VPTLATALKPLGYRTALFGKWHLGLAEGSRPEHHGFDEWFGFLAGCVDYYSHIFYWGMNRGGPGNDPTHDLWHNGTEVWQNGEYLTEVITERSVEYVRRSAGHGAPFFLFVSFNAPHYPMHAPKKYIDRFPGLAPDRRIMAAMLSAMDDGVGEICAELDRQGIREDTAVFFMSDNGPSRETRNWLDGRKDPYYGGTAGSLKGHKFSLYEGGIRVLGIVSWPARIPGGQVIDSPGVAMDVFPTFLKAAGGDPGAYGVDGIDLMPLLVGGESGSDREIFWEMREQTAMRRGPWKLVLKGQLVEGAPPEDEVHLANLDEDIGERRNLAGEFRELATELTAVAEAWRVGIEQRWTRDWQPQVKGTTTFPDPKATSNR
jgi:arylsulfatase A-like enzyme